MEFDTQIISRAENNSPEYHPFDTEKFLKHTRRSLVSGHTVRAFTNPDDQSCTVRVEGYANTAGTYTLFSIGSAQLLKNSLPGRVTEGFNLGDRNITVRDTGDAVGFNILTFTYRSDVDLLNDQFSAHSIQG